MNRLGLLLLCLIVLLGSVPGGYYSYRSGQEVATLKANVCKVVAESGRGNVAQQSFWLAAQQRALLRSHHEGGDLRASDLDAARNDARLAAVYAASKHFHFPGC